MGLLDVLKKILFPPPKRDISRVNGIEEDEIDLVEETVDMSGGPLKEHHRRRALHDRRLLPKKKPQVRLYRPRRRTLMTSTEAGRLFSSTMRTHNRTIRTLLSDEEQLKLYDLPLWNSEEEVARALNISVGMLRYFSIHRDREVRPHYFMFKIPKRRGASRTIMAPMRDLKALQRKLLHILVNKLPVSDCAHGFRRGRSIRTGAEPHAAKRVVLNMDIKDFFPSVHFGRVRGYLIALGYGYPVATTLAVLMTGAERQPVEVEGTVYHVPIGSRYCVQGAPTSPGLCNSIALGLDRRLLGIARSFSFDYTRYADDLTFSGNDPGVVHKLRAAVRRIVEEEGFSVNPEKTRIMRSGRRQTVTGVVVNKEPGLSRKERRRLRAMAHRLQKEDSWGPARKKTIALLKGKIAFLHMLNAAQAMPFREIIKSLEDKRGTAP
jgi:RNA-directed DNA polymerase